MITHKTKIADLPPCPKCGKMGFGRKRHGAFHCFYCSHVASQGELNFRELLEAERAKIKTKDAMNDAVVLEEPVNDFPARYWNRFCNGCLHKEQRKCDDDHADGCKPRVLPPTRWRGGSSSDTTK